MDKITAVAAELRASLPKGSLTDADILLAAKWMAVNWQRKVAAGR